MSFIRNAKVGDWVLFPGSVSFGGPLFTLKSGSVTECNLHGRYKKGRWVVGGGWGWGVVLPYKSDGGARQKISRTPLIGYQNLVLWACLLQIIF